METSFAREHSERPGKRLRHPAATRGSRDTELDSVEVLKKVIELLLPLSESERWRVMKAAANFIRDPEKPDE